MSAAHGDFPFTPFPNPAAPPYALSSPSFRFRALASLAGRAPLGGAREVVLATYLVARLADDCRPLKELPAETRVTRAVAARSWLANTALPGSLRVPLARLAEATEGDLPAVASALATLITAAIPYLDEPSRVELERLARALTS